VERRGDKVLDSCNYEYLCSNNLCIIFI